MESNILIVEDNFLIAEDLKQSLEKNNFHVVAIVDNAEEAIVALNTYQVNLVMIDIVIKGDNSGIDLAEIIHINYQIPFIYLTSNSDKKTISKALKHQPKAYLLKPFTDIDIFTNVKLALVSNAVNVAKTTIPSIVIKVDGEYVKIKFSDLFYVKSDGNYLKFNTANKEYLTRMNFKEFSKNAPDFFVQIHKSYYINANLVTFFNKSSVQINAIKLPIGRAYKQVIQQF
jgi:DNA-binding LytR/AlgR family response regulator